MFILQIKIKFIFKLIQLVNNHEINKITNELNDKN